MSVENLVELRIQLTRKQTRALLVWFDFTTRTIVYGGAAGGGKSWLSVVALMCLALAYPDTRYYLGRNEIMSIIGSTYGTFQKFSRQHSLCYLWKFDSRKNNMSFSNGSEIRFLELKYKPSDPLCEKLGGTEYTSGAIDEASEVHYAMVEALRTRTGRQHNDKYGLLPKQLLTSNPKKCYLYQKYYKPWVNGTLPLDSIFIPALVHDNLFIDSNYIYNLEHLDSDVQKQRLLYGNWDYEDEPDQLIEYPWILQSFHNDRVSGNRSMGVDVAEWGRDFSVIAKMDGNSLYFLKRYKMDPTKFSDVVYSHAIDDRIDCRNVCVDGIGYGAATYGGLLNNHSFTAYKFVGSESQVVLPEFREYAFYNVRSQMFWLLREDFRNGDFHINLDIDDTDVQLLIEELVCPSYELRGERVIKVESKDDMTNRKGLGRSPDLLDAVAYCNFIRHLRMRSGVRVREAARHIRSAFDIFFG